jgi:translation initiation factor IF-2
LFPQAAQMQGDLRGSVEALLSGLGDDDGKEKLELPVVIKADGPGTAEALAAALRDLISEDEYFKVTCKVLTAGVGELVKSDIAIAGVSNAYVIAFNTAANNQAIDDARRAEIDIGYFNVVYDVLDTVQAKLDDIRSPTPDGVYVGKAEVKVIFSIGKVGNIAGSAVIDGEVQRGANVRIMRLGRVVHEGKLKVLKNVKADVESMVAGTECGIQVTDFEDFQVGDFIECYIDE